MSHQLNPRPQLASAEYWDGIDINNAEHFAVEESGAVHLTRHEHSAAAAVLASCLAEVMRGDYVEVDSRSEAGFESRTDVMADGAVVVIDREHLTRLRCPPEQERKWGEPTWPSGPAITSDFSGYWRANQPYHPDKLHFGDEQAVFVDKKMIYSRHLQWGVLISRKGGNRLLATWAFSAPYASPDGVAVPVSNDAAIFRTAETLPLPVKTAMTIPDLVMEDYTIRMIKRVRGLKVVHAATASYEPRAHRESLAQKLGNVLGKTVPQPAPHPV